MNLSRAANAVLIAIVSCFAMAATMLTFSIDKTDNSIEHSSRVDIGWTAARGNVDAAEFMNAASEYSRKPTPSGLDALTLRFEILAGRVDLFLAGQFAIWLKTDARAMTLVQQMKTQVTAGRHVLHNIAAPGSIESMLALGKLVSYEISVLSSGALQFSSRQIDEDREILRTLHTYLLYLMIGLFTSGGAVMVAMVWQNRRVRAAHRAQQHLTRRFEHLATHDALTGLSNRDYLQRRLKDFVGTEAKTVRIAAISLDLDRFKQVNDTLGHYTGDRLLISVADRLRAVLPASENVVVSRFGGDEFAILIKDVGRTAELSRLIETLLGSIRTPHLLDGHTVITEASVGVAVWPDHAADDLALLRDADIALKRVKSGAKGTWCLFEQGMEAGARQRYEIENALSHALSKGEFHLVYQPQVNLLNGAVCGVEALLRWRNPVLGSVPPVEFIQVAEETGLIVSIGEWVLRTACRAARAMPDDIAMAVNLSAVQFIRGDIVGVVASVLKETGLAPHRLELEITESFMLRHGPKTLEIVNLLKALGVKIALDDFGTGYSSLSYLRSYPFDKLKTDRSFIVDIEGDAHSRNILHLIVEFGRILGMSVVAEGVETEGQAGVLRAAGCHHVQGYLFGRPMSEDLLSLRLRERAPRVHQAWAS